MEFGRPELVPGIILVLGIILISLIGWIISNWIRAKHSYPIENEMGGKSERIDTAETQRLEAENRDLHDKLDAMQDRMIVLEKIVTDKGYTLAEEIEALRDIRNVKRLDDPGVPQNIEKREKA